MPTVRRARSRSVRPSTSNNQSPLFPVVAGEPTLNAPDAKLVRMSVAPEPVKRVVRTVTKPYQSRPDVEMTTIGWLLFLGLLFILVPLLPFLVAYLVVTKAWSYVSNQLSTSGE